MLRGGDAKAGHLGAVKVAEHHEGRDGVRAHKVDEVGRAAHCRRLHGGHAAAAKVVELEREALWRRWRGGEGREKSGGEKGV